MSEAMTTAQVPLANHPGRQRSVSDKQGDRTLPHHGQAIRHLAIHENRPVTAGVPRHGADTTIKSLDRKTCTARCRRTSSRTNYACGPHLHHSIRRGWPPLPLRAIPTGPNRFRACPNTPPIECLGLPIPWKMRHETGATSTREESVSPISKAASECQ